VVLVLLFNILSTPVLVVLVLPFNILSTPVLVVLVLPFNNSNTSTTNTGVERMLSSFFSTSDTCRDNSVHINLLSYFFLQAFKSKPDRFADKN
jgi:hypothetical protein